MLIDYLQTFLCEDTGKINYGDMIQDLNRFNFDQETNFGILPRSAHSISSGQASIPGTMPRRNVFNAEYTVVDAKQAP